MEKSADKETVATQTAGLRKALGTLEAQLRNLVESGVCTDDALWIGGKGPSHADFSVYGTYAWTRLSNDLVEQGWHHADLPYVGKWLEGFKKHGLVKEGELY
jgi:glutathione S-transferase